jgi:hypothetical protein
VWRVVAEYPCTERRGGGKRLEGREAKAKREGKEKEGEDQRNEIYDTTNIQQLN